VLPTAGTVAGPQVACHFYQAKGFMRLCALVNFYTISCAPPLSSP